MAYTVKERCTYITGCHGIVTKFPYCDLVCDFFVLENLVADRVAVMEFGHKCIKVDGKWKICSTLFTAETTRFRRYAVNRN